MNTGALALATEQQLVLQTAYDVFRERGEWPTHQYVDSVVRNQANLSLWRLLHDLPTDLIQQPVPYGNQDRVKVRVRGLVYCPNAGPDLSLFSRALAWLVRRRKDFRPDPTAYQDLQVTANDFRLENFPLGHGPSDTEFTKTYELLMGEPLGLGGSPGQFQGGWTVFIPSDILDYDGVSAVEQYLARLDTLFPSQPVRANPADVAAIDEILAPPQLFHTLPHPPSVTVRPPGPPRVFIVHGHDDQAREDTDAYLRELGLQPVVLQDQPNIGRTIIEKVEENADVDYAVVLITPDDLGRKAANEGTERARARQNVIFELGFFIGKLGRRKVCLLYKPDPEIPSDLHGVAYVALDSPSWKAQLRTELRAAGIDVGSANTS